MKRCSFLLLWLLAVQPVVAHAEPALKAIPPGEDRIEAVAEGQSAPFSGQLFDSPTALRWGNYLAQCRERLVLDVAQAEAVGLAQVEFWKTRAELEEARYVAVSAELTQRIDELEKELQSPPFYRTTWFGVAVGAVGALAAVGGAAWLMSASN